MTIVWLVAFVGRFLFPITAVVYAAESDWLYTAIYTGASVLCWQTGRLRWFQCSREDRLNERENV